MNWVSIARPSQPLRAWAKIRSRHAKAWAHLERNSGDDAVIIFDEPQEAITPGQAAVFYKKDAVMGAAWISKVLD